MNRHRPDLAIAVAGCLTAVMVALAPAATAAPVAATADGSSTSYDGTLSVDDATPALGSRIFLKGHIRAVAGHSRAILQVRYDNRTTWKSVDHDRMNLARHFTFTERVTTERSRKYRVVVAGGHGRGRLHSKVVTVVPHP